MAVETLTLAIDAARVKRGGDQFVDAGRRIDGATRKIDRSVLRTERNVKRMGASSANAGALMARVFTGVAITAGARSAIRTYATYEQSIATVRGVLGGQLGDQEKLHQSMLGLESTARRLGATTRFSASEAAEGILFLTRAGFSANESMDAIGATLNLAQSGAIGLGEAADYASNIVSGFGLAAAETNRVVDTLVATSNRSNTDIRQLAEAMKYAAPIAGALGREVEEASAAVGVLGDSGIQGSMAGTNLRGIFVKLLNPSGEAKKAIDSLGLSIADLDPKTNSLADIFDKLTNAGADATEMTQIFMSRNAAAALTLAKNTDKLRELEQANIDAAGEAAELARVMDDTLTGSFKSMISAAQELVLQLGEGDSGFGGVLRTVVDTMTGALRILAGMESSVTENRKAAFLLAAALKGVGAAFAIIVSLKVAAVFSSLLVTTQKLPIAFSAVTKSIAPLLATVSALAITIAAFELGRYFYDEFKVVQQTAAQVVRDLNVVWIHISSGFKSMTNSMGATWDFFWEEMILVARDQARFLAGIIDYIVPGTLKNLEDSFAATDQRIAKAEEETRKAYTRYIKNSFGDVSFDSLDDSTQTMLDKLNELPSRIPKENILRAFEISDIAIQINKFYDTITGTNSTASEADKLRVTAMKERADKLLSNVDGINKELASELIAAEKRSAIEMQDAILDATLLGIEDDFGGKDRKGNSIADQIKKDLNLALGYLDEFTDDAAAKIEAIYLTNTANDPSKMGPFLPDSIRDTRKALEEAILAVEALDQAEARNASTVEAASTSYADWVEELEKARTALELEVLLLEGTTDAQRALAGAKERGIALTQTQIDQIVQLENDLITLDKQRERAEELKTLYEDLGDTIAGTFEDVVLNSKSAEDALESMVKSVTQLIFNMLVTQQIANLIAGAFGNLFGGNAAGSQAGVPGSGIYGPPAPPGALGLMSGTSITPMANGGIIGPQPTRMTNGSSNFLTREAGPEAVVPLGRDSRGRLGIIDASGGGGGGGRTININMNVQSQDAASFGSRESQRQIQRRLRETIKNASAGTPGG